MKRKGKLVWNHSTHAPGGINILQKLAKNENISTIVPGRINSNSRPSPFRIRVQGPILGGHKVVVRSNGCAQEVFITTTLDADELQQEIDKLLS